MLERLDRIRRLGFCYGLASCSIGLFTMSFAIIALIVNFASIVCCHTIARARGAKPVFWGVMGALFGPFAIPFAYFAKPA